MTVTMSGKCGISRQRGFWLRCFLSVAIGALLLVVPRAVRGQVDIPGPERLTHVSGVVVDPVGHPMGDLKVSLMRDDKVAYETQTDASGGFRFEHVSGQFTFRVARSKFAPAAQQIVVTDEVVTALERKKLYVILGPGACQDACSSVLTSKKEFDRAIREKSRGQVR
jgi:hypothetical protein